MPEPIKLKAHCQYCNEPYETESYPMPWGMQPLSFPFCSDDCQEKHIVSCAEFDNERNEFDRKREALIRYELITPTAMRETDLSKLPNIRKWIDWEPDDSGEGLTIIGKTGVGKTRLSYLILRNLMIEKGLTVEYFRPGQFAVKSHSAWMNNKIEQMYDDLLNADLVIFDDFGKEKFTETRMMDLFTTVNNRMDNLKPTIFTTNYYGKELINRFDDKDFAEPFIRRIRESTKTVNLKK